MSAAGFYHALPSFYAPVNPLQGKASLFQEGVRTFCDEVDEVAQEVIKHSPKQAKLRDLIPKFDLKIFGVFSINNGESVDGNEMSGPARALSVLAGGVVTIIASFIFGSFFSDFQESRARLERCEDFKEQFGEVWQLQGNEHARDLRLVCDTEKRLAKAEKRSSLINMALVVGVIASGALLITAAVFASVPVALAGTGCLIVICVIGALKFGANFFDKIPGRKAQQISAAIERLRQAGAPIYVRMPQPMPAISVEHSNGPVTGGENRERPQNLKEGTL